MHNKSAVAKAIMAMPMAPPLLQHLNATET